MNRSKSERKVIPPAIDRVMFKSEIPLPAISRVRIKENVTLPAIGRPVF